MPSGSSKWGGSFAKIACHFGMLSASMPSSWQALVQQAVVFKPDVVVLVDARVGLLEQSRRHAFLASLLGVPHLVLCVNKMDLVGYDQATYEGVRNQFEEFATRLRVSDLTVIPVSALYGDNVVARSAAMPWYDGPSLLHHLEQIHIASDRNLIDVRFPVQYVLRPQSTSTVDYRGYAGQVAGGVLRTGDEVMVLPSGLTTTISAIETMDGPVPEAFPPMSVTLRLADDLDISRGDMICRPHNVPDTVQDIDAMVCWLTDSQVLRPGSRFAIKHTTRSARAVVRELRYRLDINTLHREEEASELGLNEIGRVTLRSTVPLFTDPYRRNRTTGGFILIDEHTGATVAGGMISGS